MILGEETLPFCLSHIHIMLKSSMSSSPEEWTVEDVQAWLASTSVNVDASTRDIWRAQGIDGAKLLALDRRALDGLGITM